MTAQGARRWLALVAAAIVGVALAATGGPVPLATEGTGGWMVRSPRQPRDVDPRDLTEASVARRSVDPAAMDVASVAVQILAIVVIAAVIILVGRTAMRVLAQATGDPEPERSPELAPPSGPRATLSEAVDDGLTALASGPVDDVVIACWVRLEDAAAAGGVARLPSETSTDLAVRVLARFDVPGEPVERLASLYRTARYSRHRLDESDRAAAIADLREIGAAMAVHT